MLFLLSFFSVSYDKLRLNYSPNIQVMEIELFINYGIIH